MVFCHQVVFKALTYVGANYHVGVRILHSKGAKKIKAIRGQLCAEFTCSLMQVTKATIGKTQLMRCDFANTQ